MRVTHLTLSDFRNYQSAEVTFSPGLNLIIGRNGQGKTNLVEAIGYFATLGSHRVSSDAALIRAGAESAISRMKVAASDREVLLELQLNKDRPNRAQVNRNSVRPRELTRWFSCVVFAPEDLLLVRGDPGVRRRFLDEAVVARQPALVGVIADYERVVRQRTALLKSIRFNTSRSATEATLEVWDTQLVDLGTRIMLARRSLVESLTAPLRRGYHDIVEHDHHPGIILGDSVQAVLEKNDVSRETTATIETTLNAHPTRIDTDDVSRETLKSQFRQALSLVRRQEFERGVTLVGPHRDDAHFQLNGLPVKGYASHGESWSFVLALRLSLAELLRSESPTGDPVIILDDVFAELDARRRNALMASVGRFEQVIVTAAVEDDVPIGEWHTVRIAAGSVVENE